MDKTARLNAEHRDDLVAYLDGELPEGEAQQIDLLLARSEVARHEVEVLARTWEMLDLLSKPNATEGFTDRTLTTLRVAELSTPMSEQPWVHHLKQAGLAALWVLVLASCALGGYLLTAKAVPNPEAELLTDLPLLRNLDLYLEIKDLEFINALQRQTDFAAASSPDASPPANARRLATSLVENVSTATLAQRFEEAAHLPQSERDRILRNQHDFDQMTPDRQAALLDLHRQVSAEPESVHAMLETYALWLQTLSPGQRDDLRKAANSGARIELVRKFKADQEASRETQVFDLNIDLRRGFGFRWPFPAMSPEDLAVVMAATVKEFDLYEQNRINALPGVGEKYVATIRLMVDPGRTRRLNDEAIERIIAAVPDENMRRGILRSSEKDDQRRELLRRLSFATGSFLAEEMKPFMPTEKDLQELFVSDRISGDERYELMQLPPRELTMRLVQRYLDQSDDPRLKRIEGLRRDMRDLLFQNGGAFFGPRPGGFGGPRGDRDRGGPGGGPRGGPGDGPDDRRPDDRRPDDRRGDRDRRDDRPSFEGRDEGRVNGRGPGVPGF